MVEHIKGGGDWSQKSLDEYKAENPAANNSLIYLTRFEDFTIGIHDGHHRILASYIAGRRTLNDDEYQLHEWNYDHYRNFAGERGWVTPFDPITEVRKADFWKVKNIIMGAYQEALSCLLEGQSPTQELLNHFTSATKKYSHQYCLPRPYHTIEELWKSLDNLKHL